jgi:crotonobetainyl-CoA hydratase
MHQKVLVERIDSITVITINRPEALNAIDADVTKLLSAIFDGYESDDDQRAAILTGAGNRAFSAGADLKEVYSVHQRQGDVSAVSGTGVFGGFGGITRRRLSKPIIGAINGLAYGGGAEIAFALDILVAVEHATFCLPEVKRGVVAGAGGLLRLPRHLPPNIAMQLALTGEPIGASDAHQWGLVNALARPENLMRRAMSIADAIAGNAPLAVRASKAVLSDGASLPLTETAAAWDINDFHVAEIADTADAREGVAAFVERRTPVWTCH